MAEENDNNKAPDKDKAEKEAPPTPEGGQADEKEAPEKKDIPEKLQGKSAEEVAQMYVNLEKKMGEHSSSVEEAKKLKEDMGLVLQAIYADPELKTGVEKQLRKVMGLEQPSKDEGEDTKKTQDKEEKTTQDDTRRAMEKYIIRDFEDKKGLNHLNQEERQTLYKRIGNELVDMVDPGGNKNYGEILDSISLEKLPAMLDKAYQLANQDGEIEKATKKAAAEARESQAGQIGSLPSSGTSTDAIRLTPSEKEAAKKLGVSEDKFLQRKKEIAEATQV